MSIDTTELLNRLSNATDIKQFIIENEDEFLRLSCADFLNDLAAQRSISVAEVSKKSGQGSYVYKVFQGERKPSRDVILGIAIGMCLSIDESQLLLRISKLATLDPRNKRDSVVLYAIKENLAIEQLNDLLFEMNMQTL